MPTVLLYRDGGRGSLTRVTIRPCRQRLYSGTIALVDLAMIAGFEPSRPRGSVDQKIAE